MITGSEQERLIQQAYAISATRCKGLFEMDEIAAEWKQLIEILESYTDEAKYRYRLHDSGRFRAACARERATSTL